MLLTSIADTHPPVDDPSGGAPAPRGGGWRRLAVFAGMALLKLGIDRPPGHYWRSLIFSRMGVPRSGIRVLPAEVLNTRDEVQSVADELARRRLPRVAVPGPNQVSFLPTTPTTPGGYDLGRRPMSRRLLA